ncbi:MAG: oxidoreductase-like domain-containing protein [Pseudomonadota bacterium]
MTDSRPRTIRHPTLDWNDPDPAPVAPVQPDINDCCRSGCTPCVFDLYEEAMDRYRAQLQAWKIRHPDARR